MNREAFVCFSFNDALKLKTKSDGFLKMHLELPVCWGKWSEIELNGDAIRAIIEELRRTLIACLIL